MFLEVSFIAPSISNATTIVRPTSGKMMPATQTIAATTSEPDDAAAHREIGAALDADQAGRFEVGEQGVLVVAVDVDLL